MDNSSVKTRSKTEAETKEKLRRPSAALIEAKKKARMFQQEQKIRKINLSVADPFENASKYMTLQSGSTGFVYDDLMIQHQNIWDAKYPENPKRFTSIFERCNELGLLKRCKTLQSREATKEEILKKHTKRSFEQLKNVDQENDNDTLLKLSTAYDAVFVHPTTFKCATLAAGCCIDLVDNILTNKIQNGFALVRPPGHHAMENTYCGYCFFNNVALAATHAMDNHNLKRVLIVDFDVHHGQATQQMFFNDPRVVYFSIHRYEKGSFWPNLRESDFDAIGFGKGAGYNFNVPLNNIGMGNADYLSIFHQVLLPMAYEFNPELVLVSAGYDAALGCPEGEMEVTPACYAHLIGSLMPLAMGRIAVLLEGGYCIDSLSEGAALTLRALLGDATPRLQSVGSPSLRILYTGTAYLSFSNMFWHLVFLGQLWILYTRTTISGNVTNFTKHMITEKSQGDNENSRHVVQTVFYGISEDSEIPTEFPVANCYPVQNQDFLDKVDKTLKQLKADTELIIPQHRVGYAYDQRMLKHQNMFLEHVESPNRIKGIYNKLKSSGLLKRCVEIKSRFVTEEEISMVHNKNILHKLSKLDEMSVDDIKKLQKEYNSVYLCKDTVESAKLAAGAVIETVLNVVSGFCRSGISIIRPPGHHAEPDEPCGFCILNNIAIGAKYAIETLKLQRVMIFDWDIHHGNGTQHAFLNDSNVLYISIHRYDHGKFFPDSVNGNYDVVGNGSGKGFNINIPWNKKGMGDAEYLAVFHQIVMPVAYEFNPDLVLVSAGFDAAIGDPLGGCKVSPEAFGHMTHYLSLLANGKIIIALEGGYNVETISHCMAMCTKALLGDPLPPLNICGPIDESAQETIFQVLKMQAQFWKILTHRMIALPLPLFSSFSSKYFNQGIFEDDYDLNSWKLKESEYGKPNIETSCEVDDLTKNLVEVSL